MTKLVSFDIPVEFIVGRALPTGTEIAWGYHHGWLNPDHVVAICLHKLKLGRRLTGPEQGLALLLPGDLEQVDDFTVELEQGDQPQEQRSRLWLYLALAWLLENSGAEDPLETIEKLYADFDYPPEIASLVRFMPAPLGTHTGLDAIEERWRDYIERVGAEYRERDQVDGV